ncbi:MAG TPA: bacillithiol biosynthesis cysteine-adding enzyme BshC [Saprospiraceae bacterium]|nr:bacillithiol biosynthesis cysteine-adding enzyme BshC [Saprospiraceae bacterium]HMQ84539.1 bacillithiol biosynthesis cysteine-adding enzyme BshC [Saprospiraceae bacterium]
MIIHQIPFDRIDQIAPRDKAYALQAPELRSFYKYPPSLEGFGAAIQDKSKEALRRDLLVKVLKEQYQNIPTSEQVKANIERLADDNTFTVTTAHQPSLFTGPLYYIYKIISTIKLAQQLTEHYPAYQFVPIFITGGEDHDFEEVNHLHLFGKTISWESGESGSVGMMKSESLATVLEAVKQVLGSSENANKISAVLEAAVSEQAFYSGTARQLADALFQTYGLVQLDGNHAALKRSFIPIIKEEIFQQVSKPLVEATVAQLEALGFSEQAFPREINFFYLMPGLRERIVWTGEFYEVLNTEWRFSRESLEQEIEQYPERFSPNVVMRPLYQEWLLPNLAYIGGGGELAYWLERKSQFEHFGINYPVLVRRNSVLWIDDTHAQKMEKLGLGVEALFEETEQLIKDYVKSQTEHELSLEEEKDHLTQLYQSVEAKANSIDPTLAKAVAAEATKQYKVLEQLEGRLMRAEKLKHDTAINQIRSLKEKLFPGNGLQERKDNFIPFYLKYGASFFEVLMKELEPLQAEFVVVVDG